MPSGQFADTHFPPVADMTTLPPESSNSISWTPACTPSGEPQFSPEYTFVVCKTFPLLIARTCIPEEPFAMMTAQFMVSVPVDHPSGWGALLGQVVDCKTVLYHRAPTACVLAGGDMDDAVPPAFHALMNEVTRGCQALCGQAAWLE